VRFTNWIDFYAGVIGVLHSPFNFDLNVGVLDSWCASCVSPQVREASRISVLGCVVSHLPSKLRWCCVGLCFLSG